MGEAPGILTFPIRSDLFTQSVRVREVLCDHRSEFQRIQIVRTQAFGRMLLLDGHIQLSELDEAAYHECLVHIPAMAVPQLWTALIVGGGDGGVLRELLRWPSIERVDMVEIDQAVVDLCRTHFPEISAGAFDDPRANLMVQDAFPFVQTTQNRYDLIVVDSTDVYEDEEGELSEQLFTEAFYTDLRRILNPGGFVVTQSDNVVFCPYSQEEVVKLLGSVFPKVGTYTGLVPSFGGFSGYVWGSLDGDLPTRWSDRKLDPPVGMRYLSAVTYDLAFAPLPYRSTFDA